VGKTDRRSFSYSLHYFFSSEKIQTRNGETDDHLILAGSFARIGRVDHGDEWIK